MTATTTAVGAWGIAGYWLAGLVVAAAALGLVLYDPGTSERPRRYKPRHRRPWWPWWPRKTGAIVHEGATKAYADTLAEVRAEVEAAAAAEPEHMSLESVLKEVTDEHEIQEAHADLETAHILAEVRAEIDAAFAAIGYDDEVIRVRMVCARAEAALLRSAGVQRRRATWDEETGSFNRRELRALLEADGLVAA